jgi:hypothetical protein
MDTIKKVVYFGSLHDFYPVYTFEHIKEFVYVDTFPRGPSTAKEKFKKKNYDISFIREIQESLFDIDFHLKEIINLDEKYIENTFTNFEKIYYRIFKLPKNLNPKLFIFYSEETKQTVKYYTSTNFMYNMNERLMKDISESHALLVSSFIPNIKLLEYFDINYPKIFLGYTSNKYNAPRNKNIKSHDYNLLHYLHNTDNNYFTSYIAISKKNSTVNVCKDITDLNDSCKEPKDKYSFCNFEY